MQVRGPQQQQVQQGCRSGGHSSSSSICQQYGTKQQYLTVLRYLTTRGLYGMHRTGARLQDCNQRPCEAACAHPAINHAAPQCSAVSHPCGGTGRAWLAASPRGTAPAAAAPRWWRGRSWPAGDGEDSVCWTTQENTQSTQDFVRCGTCVACACLLVCRCMRMCWWCRKYIGGGRGRHGQVQAPVAPRSSTGLVHCSAQRRNPMPFAREPPLSCALLHRHVGVRTDPP